MSQLRTIRTYCEIIRRKNYSNILIQTCRFCGKRRSNTKLLDLALKHNCLVYTKMISYLKLDVDLSDNNNLPKTICMECHMKCLNCFNFFATVKKTQEELFAMFNKDDNIKTTRKDTQKHIRNNASQSEEKNNHRKNRNPIFTNEQNICTPKASVSSESVSGGIVSCNEKPTIEIQVFQDIEEIQESNIQHQNTNNILKQHQVDNVNRTYALCDVKREDIDVKVEKVIDISVPAETENRLLPTNYVHDLSTGMETASSIYQVGIKQEVFDDEDMNLDNCNFETTLISDNNLVHNYLGMSNNHEKSMVTYPIENVDVVDRNIKTDKRNIDDCNLNNYDSDINEQEEVNPLEPGNNMMSIKHTGQNLQESQIFSQEKAFSDANNGGFEKILEYDGSNTNDLLIPCAAGNLMLLNNSNLNVTNSTDNSVKSYKCIQQKTGMLPVTNANNKNDVTLLNKSIDISETPTEVSNKKTCTLGVTKENNQNYVTLHNNIGIIAKAAKLKEQIACMPQVKKANNQINLINKISTTATDHGKTLNANELDKVTKGINHKDNIPQIIKTNNQSNVKLLNKISPISTEQHKEGNNASLGKENNTENDSLCENVAGSQLLQGSIQSKSDIVKENNKSELTLLNDGKQLLNDINNDDDKSHNNDDSMVNNKINLVNDELYNNTEQNSVLQTNKNDKPHTVTSKDTAIETSNPWRFDHDDVTENDLTKTNVLWQKTFVFNNTLKEDIGKIIKLCIEENADKEISRIDPDNEYLIEKSWDTYPWLCECEAVFECVAELRSHRQYVHKKCSWFWCWDCRDKFKYFPLFVQHVRMHRYYLRFFCEHCNQKFPDITSCLDHATSHEIHHRMCGDCGEEIPDANEFREHRRRYKVTRGVYDGRSEIAVVGTRGTTWREYEWRCLECPQVERDIQSLREHLRSVHTKCFAVQCADCPLGWQTLRSLAKHVIQHRPYLRRYCYFCDQNFQDIGLLNAHVDEHFSREHVCCRCGESFPDDKQLKLHRKQFQTLPPRVREYTKILCQLCGKIITSPSNYLVHMSSHNQETETCDICLKELKHKYALRKHQETHMRHRRYICDYCDKQFLTKSSVRNHILLHRADKPFVCLVCDKGFKDKRGLQRHKATHGIINWNEFTDKKDEYICDHCGKIYKSRKSLQCHVLKLNIEKKEICKICGRKFKLKSDLKSHAKTHVLDKPFKCDYCYKNFKTKNNIRAHIYSHLHKKTHACLVCGKRFRLKCNLTVHVRSHTDARPYQCKICDRKFRDCPACDLHMRNIHGVSFFKTKITERGRVEIDRESGETRSLATDDEALEWLRNITGSQRQKQKDLEG